MPEYAKIPMKDVYNEAVELCYNDEALPEEELCSRLKPILNARPDVVHETDEEGCTLLHHAAQKRQIDFCKLLVEKDAHLVSVKMPTPQGWLPFHGACCDCNVNVITYLYHLYPQSIMVPINDGVYPLDMLLQFISTYGFDDKSIAMTRFFLQHDNGAVSTPIKRVGYLPLHSAVLTESLEVVQMVYDSFPEAIFGRDKDGETPLDHARMYSGSADIVSSYFVNHYADIVSFFETQLEVINQASEGDEPDQNGQHYIHRAVRNTHVSVGTIKLIIEANPGSMTAADNQGHTPLHIASQVGNEEAVQYLVATHEDLLMARDDNGNLPIHLACLAGKCNIIKYLTATFGCENTDGKLPIELLLYESVADLDRDITEYIAAVDLLLRSNPVHALERLSATRSNTLG